MQKQTSIYIPKPCHEDWNKMTPTQQGKFCSACNKQVVDFSLMSDNQILNFLSTQSGKLCGRFDAEQLQRPLIETKIKRKKSWWMALAMPLLFLFERGEAQENKVVGDTVYNTIESNKNISELLKNKTPICEPQKVTATLGMIAPITIKQTTISGKVVDENNNPLAFATIAQKGTKHATISDTAGNFTLDINKDVNSITVIASFIGYQSVEKKIEKDESNAYIKMKMHAVTMGDVIVVGYTVRHKPLKQIDTVKATVKKALNISSFKIYPDLAIKGNAIHLEIKQTGNYQMQLLDDQSRLVQTEEINIDANNSTTQIQLSSTIAAGIYYLRLIDEQKKKSYTEKLIIQ
jgi:hypothetical protein